MVEPKRVLCDTRHWRGSAFGHMPGPMAPNVQRFTSIHSHVGFYAGYRALAVLKHYVRSLYGEVSLPRKGLCGLREGPSQTASLPQGVLASP